MKKQRDANIELLRCLSMAMIIGLHFLNAGMGGALGHVKPGSFNYYATYYMESAFLAGVNCFVLISGYFMVNKPNLSARKAVDLMVLTACYGLGLYVLTALKGWHPVDGTGVLRSVLPYFYGWRWFVQTYLILFLLAPFLNRALNTLSRREYQRLLAIELLLFTVWYSFIQSSPMPDGGYGILNFIILYTIGGYFRLHGVKREVKPLAGVLGFLTCAGLTCLCKLYWFPKTAWGYGFLFTMAGSALLFLAFRGMRLGPSRTICTAASCTFGIFLIHSDPSLNYALYHTVLHTERFWNSPLFVAHALGSIAAIFLACMAVDLARAWVFRRTVNPLLDRVKWCNGPILPSQEQ